MTGDPLAGKGLARGAFLALAGGARFGGPFAFIRDASVQTRPFTPGNWTEDTHRSLYPGRHPGALAGHSAAGPYPRGAGGSRVGAGRRPVDGRPGSRGRVARPHGG